MTNAPEHLWIKWTQADADTPPSMMSAHPGFCVASNLDGFYAQGYTRADLIPAMLATARREALEEAAKVADQYQHRLARFATRTGIHATPYEVLDELAGTLRALAASPPTPTPVDGENSADPVGKGGA